MAWSKAKRLIGLAVLILFAALLAGCTVTPDNTGNNQSGVGNQDIVPFPIRSPDASPIAGVPTPTIGGFVVLPSGSLLSPQPSSFWGNVLVTPEPFLTPTPWGGIITLTTTPDGMLTPPPTSGVLKLGSQGDAVRAVQSRLKLLGYSIGSIDGDFGQTTESALKAFQERNNLRVDGIAGSATLGRLNSSAALPARPTPAPTRRPTPTPRINENVFLQNGSAGSDVRSMQERLISLGYLQGSATGRFDAATEAAVYAFQERNVAYSDGIAGPMTLQKLYSSSARRASTTQGIVGVTLKRGMMDSAAVRTVQTKLRNLRFYAGNVDGDFGATTEAAVKAFQVANGLTPDGKVGPSTMNKLFGDNPRGPSDSVTSLPGQTPEPTKIPFYVNVTPHPYGNYVSLREGNSGTLVRKLQEELKKQGYFSSNVDGLYGFTTTQSVKDFQKAKGLSQDGIAGPATQRILFEGNFPEGS